MEMDLSQVERALTAELYPENFYAVSSPYNDVAIRGRRIRRADHTMWQSILPEEDEDVDMILASLRASTGHGDRYLTSAIYAHQRLRELPRLKKQQERHFHLDLTRLKAIDAVLCKVDATDADLMAFLDEEITAYLTATRPNQLLPTPAQIRKKINTLIQTRDTSVSEEDSDERPTEFLEVSTDGDSSVLAAGMDTATALEIDARVHAHARAHDLTPVAALVALIRGEGTTDVTLNVYRAHDVPDAPAWIDGVGWITADAAEKLEEMTTSIRDMDLVLGKVSKAYHTPEDIRAAVIGLDGGCSYPWCTRPGSCSQMDHRINFADGGETSSTNLSGLCPRHHNIKTDGRVRYIIDPETREKIWLFDNGTWMISQPTGPLAPEQRRWVQTIGQRTQKRRNRIREEAQERKSRKVPHDWGDDPPPF